MKPTKINPKVFISYAWGNDIYQEKVRSFASYLVSNGIDVVLDQWSLEEGNDTYKFMEKSVNDPTITNVLILLDENYKIKADERQGGVGTETQIITPELYNKADQTKFIPIIFERKGNEIFRPAFLKSLKYIDLSLEESYETNLKYLTRILFGVKIYKKPELGLMPDWVTQENPLEINHFLKLDFIKNVSISSSEKEHKVKLMLNQIIQNISQYKFSIKYTDTGDPDSQDYLKAYQSLTTYKKEIFSIVSQSCFLPNIADIIANFMEELYNSIASNMKEHYEIKFMLIHEIFLNILGFFYKIEDYQSIGSIITRTYIINTYGHVNHYTFSAFYCTKFQTLDYSINTINGTKKITASGDYWLSNTDPEFCNRENLIFVDLLLNIFAQTKIISNLELFWFPKLYIYDEEHKLIRSFAAKLKSKEKTQKILKLFNLSSIEKFKSFFQNIVNFAKDKEFTHYGYHESYHSIPLLANYIKTEEIGIYN